MGSAIQPDQHGQAGPGLVHPLRDRAGGKAVRDAAGRFPFVNYDKPEGASFLDAIREFIQEMDRRKIN